MSHPCSQFDSSKQVSFDAVNTNLWNRSKKRGVCFIWYYIWGVLKVHFPKSDWKTKQKFYEWAKNFSASSHITNSITDKVNSLVYWILKEIKKKKTPPNQKARSLHHQWIKTCQIVGCKEKAREIS